MNFSDTIQYWLQGQINDAVAGHSSRIAYLEGFISTLSERLLKLEKAYPDMATTKDLLKDTRPEVLMDKLHEHIEQIVGGKLGECVKEVHLEENVEAILDRRSQASDDDKLDAQRYRWLRGQHWSDNVVGIVRHPGEVLKLGTVCYSDASLDRLIDEALAKEQV